MNIDIWDNFSIDTVIPSPVDPSIFNKTNCLGWKNELTVYSLEAIVILIIVTTLFCLFAFAGNVTVIIAIVRDRVISKHKQHLYLLSLAVADALLVVLVVPFTLTNELLGYWPFGDTYCRIYLSLDILFCTASICNICCIGIDRFVSVKYPTKYVMLRRLPRIRAAILFVSTILSFYGTSKVVFLLSTFFITDALISVFFNYAGNACSTVKNITNLSESEIRKRVFRQPTPLSCLFFLTVIHQ